MGKGERIFWADDSIRFYEPIFAFLEEEGHKVVATARSVREVGEFIEKGLDVTLVILDGNMPQEGDGQKAAKLIRQRYPQAKIVSFSNTRQTWGDENWTKDLSLEAIIDGINRV